MKKRIFVLSLFLVSYVFLLTGCKGESKWNDGEYEGIAAGMHGDMNVKVSVDSGKIKSIDIVSQNETAGVSDVAIERIPEAIIDEQKTEVDTVSGATESSKTIIAAVEDALTKAEK